MQVEQEKLLKPATPAAAQPDAVRCGLVAEALRRSGSVRLIAQGSSMLPAIWPGGELEIRSTSAHDLRPGDVAVCLVGGQFRIHRVRRVLPQGLVTQGDSLAQPDPPVAFSEVCGRVQGIPPRARIAGYLLARSDLLRGLVLRLRRRLGARPASLELSTF